MTKKTETKAATKPRAATKPAAKATAPYAMTQEMLASFGTAAGFMVNAMKYHLKAGRLAPAANGAGMVCTPTGQVHFGNGGSRHATPADVSAMRKSMLTGADFVGHDGALTKMVAGQCGPFSHRIPAGNLVAGRVDSQAQFAVLMLGPAA